MKYYIKRFINALTYCLSLCVPQTSGIIVIGGWWGHRFADNSKALYLYLSQNKAELKIKKVIYVVKDAEIQTFLKENHLDAVSSSSILSIWYHLRAKIHIVDEGGCDINRFFSTRAIKINLWHGFPLKKIGYYTDNKIQDANEVIKHNNSKGQYQFGLWHHARYLAFSNNLSRHLQYAFGCTNRQIVYGAYPRHAYMSGFIDKVYLPNEAKALERIKKAKNEGKQIVIYLPTFRDKVSSNDICLDVARQLVSFLKENGLFLITKLHFAASTAEPSGKSTDGIILNLPSESDVYNFLESADILITDYSSVYFDYMLFQKPIIFYCFDYDYYINDDRGFLYNYDDMTPGVKALNINELKQAILYVKNSPNIYKEKYAQQFKQVLETVYGEQPIPINSHCMHQLYKNIIGGQQ